MKSLLIFFVAALLLRSAIITVCAMRWLFNYRLIGNKGADRFFSAAKALEQKSDWILAKNRLR
ncbi:hypothetical protein [Mesorhizobium comanense]|uniref:hypothetical protein n=1 Tax=Mesorhizobium comanense TaxID=2502215 RepID=UPI0010F70EC4|nr:hypothetical protein [Mesorhizobium comanense]